MHFQNSTKPGGGFLKLSYKEKDVLSHVTAINFYTYLTHFYKQIACF